MTREHRTSPATTAGELVHLVLPVPGWDVAAMKRTTLCLAAADPKLVGVHPAPDALVLSAVLGADPFAVLDELARLRARLVAAGRLELDIPDESLGLGPLESRVLAGQGRPVTFAELASAAPQVLAEDEQVADLVENFWLRSLDEHLVRAEEALVGEWAAGLAASTTRPEQTPPASAQTPTVVWYKRLEPCQDRRQALARSLALWILAGSPQSRLSRTVRREAPSTYTASGQLMWHGGAQWMVFTATCAPGDEAHLDAVTRRAMSELAGLDAAEDELARAIRLMCAQTRRTDPVAGAEVARRLAASSGLDPWELDAQTPRPDELPDPDAVRREAAALFAPCGMGTTAMGCHEEEMTHAA